MRRLSKIFLILAILSIGYASAVAQQKNTSSPYQASLASDESPKLVVGIVVDQMRYEYIPRFWSKFGNGGFKRLVNKGYNFSNNHFNYVPTYTGPGHAAVYTGTTPAVNGIVGNNWYDRSSQKSMYVVSDSTAATVGASGDVGHMSPANLLSTTVTDELKTAYSKAKVVGVSVKDRAAILPAGHVADGAFWYDADSGHFVSSNWYVDQLPAWVRSYNQQKYAKTFSNEVWKPLLPITHYSESNPDKTPYEEAFEGEPAPVFPHKMNGSLSRIISSPFGNTLVRKLAEAAVDGEQMGRDKVTDFLAVSFSSTDYVGHRFGPHSTELEDTYLRLDQELSDFLSYLDDKVGEGQYLIFLTADHGAVDVPASLEDRNLPGGYFDSETAIDSLQTYLKAKYGPGQWVESYMNRQLYLNHDLFDDESVSKEIVQHDAAGFLLHFAGVASTNTAYNMKSVDYTEGTDGMIQNGFYPNRSGDVMITLKPGWLDSSHHTGTSHGSPYSYDTHVPLLFYGWNIPHGRTNHKTVIPQIAPTISAMLNITFPSGSADHPLVFNPDYSQR